MKISKSLMDAVVGALSEPVNIHSPRGNQVTEAWKNNYKYARSSSEHSSGRHYTDARGVRHDDEGYSSDGNGPADRRERAMHSAAKPAATKHYHEVPYAKKEDAKAEGMKWHAEKKKWYHTDAGKSATSKFKKLHEEVEQIDEAKKTEHHDLLNHLKSAGYEVTREHDASKDPDYKGSKDHRVWLKHKDGQPHDKEAMRDHLHDKFQAFGGSSHHGDTSYDFHGQHGGTKWSLRALPHDMHHDHGHAVLTTYPKKLHEDAEQLDEAAITVRDNLGDKTTLTGKKVGKNPHGYTVHAGSTRYHRGGGSGKAHNVWVMHGDKLIASHSTNDEHVHKKAIAHAKTSSHFWSHHEPHKDFYLHNHDEPKLVKEGTEDELNEELRERLAANAATNKDRTPIAGVDHVKKTEGNARRHYQKKGYNVHDAYHHSTLDEALQEDFLEEENGHATRKAAEGRLEALEKKHPLAKHSVIQGRRTGRWHVVRHTSSGQHIVESVDELLNENEDHDYVSWAASDGTANSLHDLHKDHQKKVKAFVKSSHWKEVDKKHTDPKTGEKHVGGHVDDDTMHAFHKWHKETHGTEHKPFHSITEDCGLDSKGDWKSYKSKADKKKSDGIDDDGGDKKPKDNIKEGDESEADYQAYLKTLKGNKDKKLSTIKSVRGGK